MKTLRAPTSPQICCLCLLVAESWEADEQESLHDISSFPCGLQFHMIRLRRPI